MNEIELLIIADDFTGALDTGVQYAAKGIPTRVITDPNTDLSRDWNGIKVLVMDAETRHLSPEQAYNIVYQIAEQAMKVGIVNLYKKTDSALRGNIGAELTAIKKATGCRILPFLPAFPQIGRTTRGGVHYIGDLPVAESVFGQDPFEPVTRSEVAALISEQSSEPVTSLRPDEKVFPESGILVFDAETEDDLRRTGRYLQEAGFLRVCCGCAGFGAVEQELLGLSGGMIQETPRMLPGFVVVCGSVNPITQRQLNAAEQAGFARLTMDCAEKLTPGYFMTEAGREKIASWRKVFKENSCRIIDANDVPGGEKTKEWAAERGISIDGIRIGISQALGDIVLQIIDWPEVGTLLITGGDTLLACMKRIGISELDPLTELFPGVVLSRFMWHGEEHHIISKSGGFGEETLFSDIARQMAGI